MQVQAGSDGAIDLVQRLDAVKIAPYLFLRSPALVDLVFERLVGSCQIGRPLLYSYFPFTVQGSQRRLGFRATGDFRIKVPPSAIRKDTQHHHEKDECDRDFIESRMVVQYPCGRFWKQIEISGGRVDQRAYQDDDSQFDRSYKVAPADIP